MDYIWLIAGVNHRESHITWASDFDINIDAFGFLALFVLRRTIAKIGNSVWVFSCLPNTRRLKINTFLNNSKMVLEIVPVKYAACETQTILSRQVFNYMRPGCVHQFLRDDWFAALLKLAKSESKSSGG